MPRKRSQSAVGQQLSFVEAFDISVGIDRMERELGGPTTKRRRTVLNAQIRADQQRLTPGKKDFAASNHRKVLAAAREIILGNPPKDPNKMKAWEASRCSEVAKLTVAEIIRQLHRSGATSYVNADGRISIYTDSALRELLQRRLKLNATLKACKGLMKKRKRSIVSM